MMTPEQRQEAASDVTATLMDWFPNLTGLECERISKLAVAACDRAVDIEQVDALAYARKRLAEVVDDQDPVATGMRLAYREMAVLLRDA